MEAEAAIPAPTVVAIYIIGGFSVILILIDVIFKTNIFREYPTDSMADMVLASVAVGIASVGRHTLDPRADRTSVLLAWILLIVWTLVVWYSALHVGKWLETKTIRQLVSSYVAGVLLFIALLYLLSLLGITIT